MECLSKAFTITLRVYGIREGSIPSHSTTNRVYHDSQIDCLCDMKSKGNYARPTPRSASSLRCPTERA
jgi:hypothetical protein